MIVHIVSVDSKIFGVYFHKREAVKAKQYLHTVLSTDKEIKRTPYKVQLEFDSFGIKED